jgi:esterase/lipase superfamily enzyme
MFSARTWPVALICLVMAGCAGPRNVMLPVSATAPGTQSVSLLVATTRRATPEDPGTLFSGERSRRTSFSQIDISIPPIHRVGEIEWPEDTPGDPARNFVVARADRLDRDGFRRALRERIRKTGEHRVLLFVHGYNNPFDSAVFRFAQIMQDSGTRAVPVLFTWPSRGKLLSYPYDQESATFSRDALEAVLADIAAEGAVQDIAVLAHSMGNWVTLEALRQHAIRRGRVDPKIRNVMLAAPDVDIDVARTQLRALGPNRPRITLFVSQDDRALAISQALAGSAARLGSINPKVEPYRTAIARESIVVVDLTKTDSADPLNHGTFAEAPDVVRSIGARLAAGQTITPTGGIGEGLGTLVNGTARTIGAAATAVVSVPVAVVDPQARSDLGDRVRAIVPGQADPDDLATD